jgi:hypothetical protein
MRIAWCVDILPCLKDGEILRRNGDVSRIRLKAVEIH